MKFVFLLLYLFAYSLAKPIQWESELLKITDVVYLDINIGGTYAGRIEIGLFGEIVPKTVRNFKALADEDQGSNYQGLHFHRVMKRFMIESGDVTHNNGSGGYSIYGRYFNDENYVLKHCSAGWVGMSNTSKNKNNSQFYITTVATPWLDGRYVVFGKVINGMSVVRKIEQIPTDEHYRPLHEVIISHCEWQSIKEPVFMLKAALCCERNTNFVKDGL